MAAAFPEGFLWGAATSSHQVEGDARDNDWWDWEQRPGAINDGTRSEDAAGWWSGHAEADLRRAAALGHGAHRLSVEWSRLEPSPGRYDAAAFARYAAILDTARALGLRTMVTLHHFTLPRWAAAGGSWLDPGLPARLGALAARCARAWGDRVDLWATINEPNVYAVMGWSQNAEEMVEFASPSADFPPGKHDTQLVFKVVDHLMLAHGAAYQIIHRVQPSARVGLAHHMRLFDPARPNSLLDRFCTWNRDRLFNQIPLNAVIHGHLDRPIGLTRRVGNLKNSVDFIGLNYYSRDLIQFDRHNSEGMIFGRNKPNPHAEMSDMNYGEIYPRGLFRLLKRLGRYNKPIYITENGLPDLDDDQRPRFLVQTLREVWKAINENVPVMGYYHWTLTDNFEWAEGWNLRFGLVKLNPETQERTLRRSGELYGEMARLNAIDDELVYRYTPELFETLFPG